MKNLLAILLIVETGCWAKAPSAVPQGRAGTASGISSKGASEPPPANIERCATAGDELVLEVCREDVAVAWKITNRLPTRVFAFVAPPSGSTGRRSSENAYVSADDGAVTLFKVVPPLMDGEAVGVGVVTLEPGGVYEARVPLKPHLERSAPHFSGFRLRGSTWIRSVSLEIGYAEARGDDELLPANKPDAFPVVLGFQRRRQRLVRSPPVPWQ